MKTPIKIGVLILGIIICSFGYIMVTSCHRCNNVLLDTANSREQHETLCAIEAEIERIKKQWQAMDTELSGYDLDEYNLHNPHLTAYLKTLANRSQKLEYQIQKLELDFELLKLQ